ncbi:peptidase, M48 family protein [Mycolicibacterium phlei]|uniref:M48 family metallopeptidase n=1 Tax=Mycobacteroides chelonae TaxID=1774 RepID=UPI000618B560|nr:M48 family metallopeptidase [Mycobacteroides chelonae]VEG17803.1 peptidase, M48 family protein [Mycolicibacterium phlei]AKC39451.1 Zn-dependent protease [Mycobacteroides chelonae]ANA98917.1 Zn-dependent protease [Mycobacteroides chelonae CCUG 47445]OLT72658.1 Zn-dependent protease [Mycobacteroides chelonae]ORV11986.1 Zn-dependent protease [Mycobacteroides chelonae]
MSDLPTRTYIEFPGISTRAWEHPADRAALQTLRSLKGFDTVLKALAALLRERQHRLMYLATAIRVDDRQFSSLNDTLNDCARILDAPEIPELYVIQGPYANAFTIGMDRPFIVLTSGLLDLMNEQELRFVVGHELGHALSGHAVYRTMLLHLMRLAGNLGWMPIGGWALRAVVAALMEWQRKSELSGDRAGMLCGQDVDTAIRVEMKLAGGSRLDEMDTQRFLAQAAEYERTGDMRDGVLKLLNLELQSHPFSVLRAAELSKWIDRGEYGAILGGNYPRREDDVQSDLGSDFRSAARSYKENFDSSTDPLISALRNFGSTLDGVVNVVGQGVTDVASDVRRRFSEWRNNSDDEPRDDDA